jgi:hypothetical protein
MLIKQTINFGTVIETSGDDQYIAGYASVFFDGSDESQRYDGSLGLYERIAPTAFDRSIRDKHKVEARYNHSADHLLGRTDLNTVTLATDARGLRYRVRFDASDPDHQKVAAKINSGLIEGSSFMASPTKWVLSKHEDDTVVTYTDLDLIDVGPVNHPGMKGTGQPVLMGEVENAEEFKEELKRWLRTQAILNR